MIGVQGTVHVQNYKSSSSTWRLSDLAKSIRDGFRDLSLLVTGGFSRGAMRKAIEDGDCSLIGIGRPSVLVPTVAMRVTLEHDVNNDDAHTYARRI